MVTKLFSWLDMNHASDETLQKLSIRVISTFKLRIQTDIKIYTQSQFCFKGERDHELDSCTTIVKIPAREYVLPKSQYCRIPHSMLLKKFLQ